MLCVNILNIFTLSCVTVQKNNELKISSLYVTLSKNFENHKKDKSLSFFIIILQFVGIERFLFTIWQWLHILSHTPLKTCSNEC